MSDYSLTARSPFERPPHDVEGVSIAEVTGRAIVSVSVPARGKDALSRAFADTYRIAVPSVGSSCVSEEGTARLLGLQRDQMFLLFDCLEPGPVRQAAARLGNSAYLTDQSDSWAMIEASGPNFLAAMERLCPVDLDEQVFPVDGVIRTVMEHLAVIIIREKSDSFVLLSPRSSAASFLQMLETAVSDVS